jgi:predicted RNA-binding protein with PIN domain
MALLIDGYNLLHATAIVGRGKELTELHRSREALLGFLAQSIELAERKHTTIVFDAAGAPPGLPRTVIHDEITVHFARDYADADAMLEDLISANDTPRSLVVVSSDHRVQRAARRRKAQPIDSDRWYAELWAARHRRNAPSLEMPQKPTGNLSPDEVAYWTRQFVSPSAESKSDVKGQQTHNDDEASNPFPPGYGEDLLEGND